MRRKWIPVLLGTSMLFLCLGFNQVFNWNAVNAQIETNVIQATVSIEGDTYSADVLTRVTHRQENWMQEAQLQEVQSQDPQLRDGQSQAEQFQYVQSQEEQAQGKLLAMQPVQHLYEWEIQAVFEEVIMDANSIIPSGTKVLNVIHLDEDLLIDFSTEFLSYGGNTYEEALVSLILETGFSFPEVNSITVYIAGELQNFVEGSEINRYTRDAWQERKVGK